MDTTELAQQLAETAVQAGMDEAARIVSDYLDQRQGKDDPEYLEGLDDALCVLIQAGATDPRLS